MAIENVMLWILGGINLIIFLIVAVLHTFFLN